MIRRAIVVLLIILSSMVGLAPIADAGELCVRALPSETGAEICIPTQF